MAVTSTSTESPGSLTRFKTDWVKARMRDHGFARIEDLATEIGISRQQLSNIFNHRWLPSTPTAKRLAAALRCASDDLTEEIPAEAAQGARP